MSANFIDPARLIANLFDQARDEPGGALNHVTDRDYALHICIELNVQNFGYERDGNTFHPEWQSEVRLFLHVMITASNRVYIAESQEGDVTKVDPKLFQNTSNHSSCWREDGLRKIWATWIWACDFVNKDTPEPHRLTPNETHVYANFGSVFHRHPINYVKVHRGPYVDESHRYHDTVARVERLKATTTLEPIPAKEQATC